MFTKRIIATFLTSVMMSSTLLGSACMTSPNDGSRVGSTASALDLSQFDPYEDCNRPAEDVLAEMGVYLTSSSFDPSNLGMLLAQVSGLCDGVPDLGEVADPGTGPADPVEPGMGETLDPADPGAGAIDTTGTETTEPGFEEPAVPMFVDATTVSPGGHTIVVYADVWETVFKCILGIVGADVALDIYEAIKVPWKSGLRGTALAKDAGEILWNRVKRKGFKYAMKALGGIGGAIACFVDIIGAVAVADVRTDIAVARPAGEPDSTGLGCHATREGLTVNAN